MSERIFDYDISVKSGKKSRNQKISMPGGSPAALSSWNTARVPRDPTRPSYYGHGPKVESVRIKANVRFF